MLPGSGIRVSFVTVLLTLSLPAAAGDFTQRWVVSDVHGRHTPAGDTSALVLTRVVQVGSTVFPVGNVTYYRIPKSPSDKLDAGAIAGKVGRALGVAWMHRTRGAAHVYEAGWKGRFVRLYLSDEPHYRVISVAMIRAAYAEGVAREAEYLQRAMAGVLQTRFAWLRSLWPFHDAVADDPTCVFNPAACIVSDSAKSTEDLAQEISKTNKNLEELQKQLKDGNGNFTEFNATLKDLNKKFGTALEDVKKGQKTFDQVAGDLHHATKTADEALKEVHHGLKTADKFEKQYERTNDVLESFMDIDHAFVWAAATSAGAALGALTVSTAVDAVVQGGAALLNILHEAVTHEKEEAKILDNFQKAREIWEQRQSTVQELEQLVDNMLSMKQLEAQFGKSREEVELELGAALDVGRDRSQELERRRREFVGQGLGSCAFETAVEKRKLDSTLKDLQVVTDLMTRDGGEEQVCGGLSHTFEKLIHAESDLEEARSMILGGRDVWQKAYFKRRDEMYQAFDRAKDRLDDVRDAQKDQAQKEKKRAMDAVQDAGDQMIEACEEDQGKFLKYAPLVPMILGHFDVAARCKAQHQKTSGGYAHFFADLAEEQARKRALAAVHDHAHQVADLDHLQVSPELGALDLEAYNSWFEEVADEQKCMNAGSSCPQASLVGRLRSLQGRAERIAALCQR